MKFSRNQMIGSLITLVVLSVAALIRLTINSY